jgi:hypothetical protein
MCLANAPADEVLTLRCEYGACSVCGGPACKAHDECGGCRRVICPRCDTEGGMPVTRFEGDRVPHPHCETGT